MGTYTMIKYYDDFVRFKEIDINFDLSGARPRLNQ